ncbi:putative phospholipasec [Vanrija pseudolonga]|uniref:Phospholipasec n=1 Tax=Vanrija pseudolonga TaxID=143232 RepID=A0AAF0YCI7_9TREE|nr:putative phospholipasec [Vanrija pseudolonga]
MDAEPSQPSVVVASATSSGLSVNLHPLAILNISDHYTRSTITSSDSSLKLIGALLGSQTGREVSVVNSFELIYTLDSDGGTPKVDEEFLAMRKDQFNQVFPTQSIVGWYTVGVAPTPQDVHIHNQLANIIEPSPAALVIFNPAIPQGTKQLPFTVFESLGDGGESEREGKFVQVDYGIETGEAERIAVDGVAKESGGDTDPTGQIATLTTQRNAIAMLQERVAVIVQYISGVLNGTATVDHSILRQISSLVATLPVMDAEQFKEELKTEYNDAQLTTYLTTLLGQLEALVDYSDKHFALHPGGPSGEGDFGGVRGKGFMPTPGPPPLDYRWLHTGTKQLDLPTEPIATVETAYKPFSPLENDRIEAAWQDYPQSLKRKALDAWGVCDGEWSQKSKETKAKEVKEPKDVKDTKDAVAKKAEKGGKTDDAKKAASKAASTKDVSKERLDAYQAVIEKAYLDHSKFDVVEGVPVSQDSLFEVSLSTLSLHPVYWRQYGPRIPVIRGTWFVGDGARPCTWDLAAELEKGFQEIKPWQPSYKEELATALAVGASGEEKLMHKLPARFGSGLGVIFEDENKCRVIASGTFNYLSRQLWSSVGARPGGVYFHRGYTAALAAKEAAKSGDKSDKATSQPSSGAATPKEPKDDTKSKTEAKGAKPSSSKDSQRKASRDNSAAANEGIQDVLNKVKKDWEGKRKAFEEQAAPVIHASNDDKPCTDLILLIHGIGQDLAKEYEGFNFIYASNQLRRVLRKQSGDPAIASVMRDGRFQVLPVQWRANLNLNSSDTGDGVESERDNVFTIADITIKSSIPYVRDVTNSVLLDIPLFMSHHRQQMIEAVCAQANRTYRLWMARNPGFEKYGRVHIVAHSLGSALAGHILSTQPTTVPRLSLVPKDDRDEVKDRFLFNTSNLFLAGSPLSVFLQLEQAHLIPRGGRLNTRHSRPDEVITQAGKFGCLSVDSLYNIFYPTDPVAYAMNAAVDVAVAKTRPPLPIPSVAGSFLPPLPSMPSLPALPALPQLPQLPDVSKYIPSYFSSGDKKPKVEAIDAPTEIELSGGPAEIESKGERRFADLNPHGSIDFSLPSASVNGYLDMITSHGSYWSDQNFGAFLLAETFTTPADRARTGAASTDKAN